MTTYAINRAAVHFRTAARASRPYDNRVTLQKLEVLCTVVELGGVSRAADHLWVAQSVVSGHLRSLEERLGVQVLYRDGQRMQLTGAGQQVYEWARQTLSETQELMHRLADLSDAASNRLAIAASFTTGSYVLPPMLADFRRANPSAAISMSVSDPGLAITAVASGECNLGIVVSDMSEEHPRVACEAIGQEDIVLVVAPQSIPEAEALTLDDLCTLPLVGAPHGDVARAAIDRALERQGASPQNVMMELGDPEAMKRVVRSGLGACLLFRSCVEDELRLGSLRAIPLTDATLSLPILSVSRSDRDPSPMEAQMADYVRSRLASREHDASQPFRAQDIGPSAAYVAAGPRP